MSITTEKFLTAEQFLELGDIGPCELIFGKINMMSPAGMEHGAVALRIGRILGDFVDQHDLGEVFAGEAGYVLARDPDLVRVPDISFISKARLRGQITRGFFQGPPDLAVEVVSPNDSKNEVTEKARMWLDHGTVSVWICDPSDMTLTLHRAAQSPQRLAVGDVLNGEPTLPAFTTPINKIYKRP